MYKLLKARRNENNSAVGEAGSLSKNDGQLS